MLQTAVAQLGISSGKELPKSDAVSLSFSSSDWLCKVVVPLASSHEDSKIEWLWFDMWI